MIQATHLTRRFANTVAVDDASFTVKPGYVTGFLGPNGAGKSTTMRMILGLDVPTSGMVTVHGRRYVELEQPLRCVGALLDASAIDGGRTAANHLRWLAASNRIEPARVDAVLGTVGLADVADHRIDTFSLGMRQRLGIAAALLGDPETLIFDEPVNGLDPEGIHWIRRFLRDLASEGRTVFLSSHVIAEMAHVAERLVVIGRGHVIAEGTTAEIVDRPGHARARVRAAQPSALRQVLAREHVSVDSEPDGAFLVTGMDAAAIGYHASVNGIALVELGNLDASLEDAFFELTNHDTEYRAGETVGAR
jgi:ABC-2 type transport system ATP-binding protein